MADLPIGFICVWPSADPIPTGWQECDGTNGTPDLRGKVAMCAGTSSSSAVGTSGNGAADFMAPLHTHTASGSTSPAAGSGTSGHGHAGAGTLDSATGGDAIFQETGVSGGMTAPTSHTHAYSWDASAAWEVKTGTGYSAQYHKHGLSGTSDAAGATGLAESLPPVIALYHIQRLS